MYLWWVTVGGYYAKNVCNPLSHTQAFILHLCVDHTVNGADVVMHEQVQAAPSVMHFSN